MLRLLVNKAVSFELCLCFVRMRKTNVNFGRETKPQFLEHCTSIFPLVFCWSRSLTLLRISLVVSRWVQLLSNEKATFPICIHKKWTSQFSLKTRCSTLRWRNSHSHRRISDTLWSRRFSGKGRRDRQWPASGCTTAQRWSCHSWHPPWGS